MKRNSMSVAVLVLLFAFVSGCSGNSSPESATETSTASRITSSESSAAAADTETYPVRGLAGFETGLVKLATIDGRITGRDEVTVNWGDRSASGALFANCAFLQPRRNCEIWGTHTYAVPGTYTVGVTYTIEKLLPRNEVPETVTTTATIEPVDGLVVVALGDSYYSGEGSPLHTATTIGGDKTGDTALWDEPSINYYDGAVGPIVDSNGNEYVAGDSLKTCHRSALSGLRLATKSLASDGTPITFINMPCSGAKLGNGYQIDPLGGTPGTVRDTGNFINEQLDWVRTRVPRIDALLVSAGGNNVGFASTIDECLCIDEFGNGLASCVREDFLCSTDLDLARSISGYFTDLNGLARSDGAYIKGEYDLFADDVACRSAEEPSRRPPNSAVTQIGSLCADVQFALAGPLIDDGVPVPLVDAGYSSQNGKVINTKDAVMEVTGGCHRFVIDTSDPAQSTLSAFVVDKEASRCGSIETEFSKSAPFGEIMYVRGEFDDWARVPDWSRRFVNLGDGTLQAEFVLPAPPEDTGSWRFKIAGMQEHRVPGVTILNHYPDVTRDEDGQTPGPVETALCTGFDIAPSEWDFLQSYLVIPLFNSINTKAVRYGWKTIGVGEFSTHGYCTGPLQRWMVRPAESLARQEDLSGSAHPNWEGHEYYSRQIRSGIIDHTPPRTTAIAEVNGTPYEFGSVTNQDVTFALESDLTLTGSGVSTIYYGIGPELCSPDTNANGACTQYEGPVTVSDSGIHMLSFYGTSVTGAPETRVWPEVIVIDKEPPEMTCDATPGMLWPPNGKFVEVNVDVTAFDVVAGPVDFELVAIADSQDNVAEDVAEFVLFTDDTNGYLRSRRDGAGPGRIYTLTYESSDPFGNSATCAAQIEVPHDQGRP